MLALPRETRRLRLHYPVADYGKRAASLPCARQGDGTLPGASPEAESQHPHRLGCFGSFKLELGE